MLRVAAAFAAAATAAASDTYWWNSVTGEVFTGDGKPDAVREAAGHVDAARNNAHFWIDPETYEPTWDKPEAFAWIVAESEEHDGREYYYNTVSKERAWEKPELLAWEELERGFWYNNVTGESTREVPEAIGHASKEHPGSRYWIVGGEPTWEPPEEYAWRRVESDEHEGREYFSNDVTGETTWKRPAALGWSLRSQSKTYYYNTVTGESTRARPEPLGIGEDAEGNVYFKDPETGESTWDKPVSASWHKGESDEHDGREFYFNDVTNERAWEIPADSQFAWQLQHEEL